MCIYIYVNIYMYTYICILYLYLHIYIYMYIYIYNPIGASGAFMFFCGSGEFIVKTIKSTEAKILHQSLRQYYAYLKNNKNSLLCRFLGSYSLNMYAQTFYFVVMSNCFDPKADINER
jgi:1-phosphatidylinositol-4-phosphate 5-kinase